MIVDRYDPVNLSELIPELRLEMEPELVALLEVRERERKPLWTSSRWAGSSRRFMAEGYL